MEDYRDTTDNGSDADTVPVCRECGAVRPYQLVNGPWRCRNCDAEFDEPKRRYPRESKPGPAALREADPDEVLPDGGVDLDASLLRIRDYVQDARRAEAVGEIDRLRNRMDEIEL